MSNIYEFTANRLDGASQSLDAYKGKVLVVVNVASKCGLTPHYEGLQKLYAAKHSEGFEVLGFPCNQFGAQEPGSEEEIQGFCTTNYGVTFPMFAKIDVNGEARHPLYAWLTSQQVGPDDAGDIAWNFTKFVIGKDGKVAARFIHRTTPDDPAFVKAIEDALSA